MSKFVMVGNECVNTDMIAKAKKVGKGKAQVSFKDGETVTIPGCIPEGLCNSNRVIQVIPAAVSTFVLYETGEDAAVEEVVNYLGLTESGELRPLMIVDGFFDFADDADGYLGMHEDLTRHGKE